MEAAQRHAGGRLISVLEGGYDLRALAGSAAANGGYFPTSWGWMAIGFGWLAAVALYGPLEQTRRRREREELADLIAERLDRASL